MIALIVIFILIGIALIYAINKDIQAFEKNRLKRSEIAGKIRTFQHNVLDTFNIEALVKIRKDVEGFGLNNGKELTLAENVSLGGIKYFIAGKIAGLQKQ